jgi:coiled-coil domain-containing protein 63/114
MSTGEKDASEVLGTLQSKGDKFTKLSVAERKRVSDLEDAIQHITIQTDKYRSKAKKSAIDVMNLHVLTPNPAYSRADGVDVGRQAQQVTTKVLTILEMKLNRLLQRQSEIIIRNKELKTEIDHYRRLRMQTNVSHAKFDGLLTDIKKEIEIRLSESADIVEQREALVQEKKDLEEINSREQAKFETEFEKMGAYIKQQNTALEDSLLKERKEDQQRKKKTASIATEDSIDERNKSSLTVAQEIEMAKQVGSYTQFAKSEESLLAGIEEKINDYNIMFEELKKMTGTESLEEVVSTYVAHEDEMFSLYNFVQTINAEIDGMKEGEVQIEEEIQAYKINAAETEEQKRSVLDDLQNRLQSTAEQGEQMLEDNQAQSEAMQQLQKKIQSVFFKLQCDQMDTKANNKDQVAVTKGATVSRPDSNVALLTSQGISEANVLDFLGCIEQRSVDIIGEYLRMKASEGQAGGAMSQMPQSPTPGPGSPMIYPASEPVIDFNELNDDDYLQETDDGDHKLVDLDTFKRKLHKKALDNAYRK